jgi:hypothetical protein
MYEVGKQRAIVVPLVEVCSIRAEPPSDRVKAATIARPSPVPAEAPFVVK